eukprot:scaffold18985_cov67-Cyclotella_meneghiniana.AAC.2
MRNFNWGEKAKGKRTVGTGRMRYMKTLTRRFKNGFREQTTAKKMIASKDFSSLVMGYGLWYHMNSVTISVTSFKATQ